MKKMNKAFLLLECLLSLLLVSLIIDSIYYAVILVDSTNNLIEDYYE